MGYVIVGVKLLVLVCDSGVWLCAHAADIAASGDSEEQSRKRKHDISPIKWTSADKEAASASGNICCTLSAAVYSQLSFSCCNAVMLHFLWPTHHDTVLLLSKMIEICWHHCINHSELP